MCNAAASSPSADVQNFRSLSTLQREELLRASWMYHDYQWFRAMAELTDFQRVNQPNQKILERIAAAEIKRLMRALGVASVRDMETAVKLLRAAGDLYVGSLCPMQLDVEGHSFRLSADRCFVQLGTKRDGLSDSYVCGPMRRVAGWLHGMELSFRISPEIGLCLPSQGQPCSYLITLTLPVD